MLALVLVSHSPQIAQGVKDLAEQTGQGLVKIFAAGGVDDQTIGTSVERIYKVLTEAYNEEGVLVLCDLGSSIMSAQMAIEQFPVEKRSHFRMSNAPLVEGAIVASVEASLGQSLDEVNASAEAAAHIAKLA
jgi:phosphoenolpyruvate---glycerone phosphotransferase subunit DhaM